MTQILGTGEGKTSPAAKEPVVERKPAQVFFESLALASSMSGYYTGPAATTLGGVTTAGLGEGAAGGAGVLSAPTPLTVALLAIFYSKGLNEGETEMLQSIRGDQLYHNLSHGQMLIGAYTRQNVTVTRQDYISEYDLRKIAQQNGTARTRVRFRIEEDPATGEMISRSYEVGERSGLDRVRVRFAEQVNNDQWQFEDTLSGVTLLWSRSAGQGRFEWEGSQTTVHDGNTGGYTTPPTPVPEPRNVWGLPNPAPEPLPPVPGTPIPEAQKPNIETLPIEDRDFNDFIIVDPMGVVPAIYVYFNKPPAVEFEIDYYGNLEQKSRTDANGNKVNFDYIPSQAAAKVYLKMIDPLMGKTEIGKRMKRVAAIAIRDKAHQQSSETYGGRNNTKVYSLDGQLIKRSERDGLDLRAAADSNWDKLSKELVNEYGLSESEIEPMRAKIHQLNMDEGWYK